MARYDILGRRVSLCGLSSRALALVHPQVHREERRQCDVSFLFPCKVCHIIEFDITYLGDGILGVGGLHARDAF